jgi:hypothetical protein
MAGLDLKIGICNPYSETRAPIASWFASAGLNIISTWFPVEK